MKKNIAKMFWITVLIIAILTGCGKSYEERLIGAWYGAGENEAEFVLYSDGTCDIAETSGTWAVVNDNIFKLDYTYYGLTKTYTITRLKDGVVEIVNDNEEITLYNEPTEEASADDTITNDAEINNDPKASMVEDVDGAKSSERKLEGDGYSSPEESVEAYINALKNGDVDAAVSTFVIESYVDKFETRAFLERLGSWSAKTGWGRGTKITGDSYEHQLLIQGRAADITQNLYTQYVTYSGFFYDDTVIPLFEENSVDEFLDAYQGEGFTSSMATMKLKEFVNPSSLTEVYETFMETNFQSSTAYFGFDEYQYIAACIEINGEDWLLAMTCCKDGDKWYNLEQGGDLGSLLAIPSSSAGLIPYSELDI